MLQRMEISSWIQFFRLLCFLRLQTFKKKEIELKSIPGVLEVGLFPRRADVYYKAMYNGSFDIIKF